jgi:hypothetical protein
MINKQSSNKKISNTKTLKKIAMKTLGRLLKIQILLAQITTERENRSLKKK